MRTRAILFYLARYRLLFPANRCDGIDTIYGNATDTIGNYIYGNGFSAYIYDLGPNPDGSPRNMLIGSPSFNRDC